MFVKVQDVGRFSSVRMFEPCLFVSRPSRYEEYVAHGNARQRGYGCVIISVYRRTKSTLATSFCQD